MFLVFYSVFYLALFSYVEKGCHNNVEFALALWDLSGIFIILLCFNTDIKRSRRVYDIVWPGVFDIAV